MPADNERIRGVTEVGQVETDDTKTSWGRTTQEGATLEFNVTREQLFSAQAMMEEESAITQMAMSMIFNLISADLTAFKDATAINAAQFSGDLEAVTPTEEKLTLDQDSIGELIKKLYIDTPGPKGPRTYEAARGQLADVGDIQMSRTEWVLPSVTYAILNTAGGTAVLTITDAP